MPRSPHQQSEVCPTVQYDDLEKLSRGADSVQVGPARPGCSLPCNITAGLLCSTNYISLPAPRHRPCRPSAPPPRQQRSRLRWRAAH